MPILILGAFAAFGYWFIQMNSDEPTTNDNLSREQFKARFHAAFTRAQTHQVPEKAAYAVAAHECGYGTGKGFRHSNNLFSIHTGAFTGKATGYWDGTSSYMTGGLENLRGYKNWEDSISDFCLGLATRPYLAESYRWLLIGNTGRFFDAFANSGYVAGPTQAIYAQRLTEIYRTA